MNWIEQFTGMIFPLDSKKLNIEGAYLLKNQHLPSSIFKYREVNENSIKNLEEDTIWLADPSNFNDPYDCAHTVDFSAINKKSETGFFAKFMEERGSDLNLSVNRPGFPRHSPSSGNNAFQTPLATAA